jgi:hypothetical protein
MITPRLCHRAVQRAAEGSFNCGAFGVARRAGTRSATTVMVGRRNEPEESPARLVRRRYLGARRSSQDPPPRQLVGTLDVITGPFAYVRLLGHRKT